MIVYEYELNVVRRKEHKGYMHTYT